MSARSLLALADGGQLLRVPTRHDRHLVHQLLLQRFTLLSGKLFGRCNGFVQSSLRDADLKEDKG